MDATESKWGLDGDGSEICDDGVTSLCPNAGLYGVPSIPQSPASGP